MTRWIAAAVLAASMMACGGEQKGTAGGSTGAAPTATGAGLTGAGSSFAYPIYSKWASMYAPKTGVKVNYQSIGSSGGIKQLSEQTVDFGASDAPMTDQQLAQAKGGPILHIPTVLGGVSITYNLPDVKQPLRFTGPVLARIFLGKITKWNDPNIAAQNPGVALPAQDIAVVHRSDGSGTSFIFTDYLSNVSPEWKSGPGKGTSISWPTGVGGKGSEGVSGQVKQTPGAIGYFELAYAKQNQLPSALIQNADGEWVAPTLESVTAAAAGAVTTMPANTDYRVSIVNPHGKGAYPISTFTWLLIPEKISDASKKKAIAGFLNWAITKGQDQVEALQYARLPKPVVAKEQKAIALIK